MTLLEQTRGYAADEIAELIANEVVAFQLGLPRDDIAVVVIVAS